MPAISVILQNNQSNNYFYGIKGHINEIKMMQVISWTTLIGGSLWIGSVLENCLKF